MIKHALDQEAGPVCMRPAMRNALSPRASRGVTLAKATDRYPLGSGVIMVPSEYALDWRRSLGGADVDWATHVGPMGVGSAMDRNDLRALSVMFDLCARGFGRA